MRNSSKVAQFASFHPKQAGKCQKGFQMVGFKGSIHEKSSSEIFRFGYGKAVNDKKLPDRVGSEVFVIQKVA